MGWANYFCSGAVSKAYGRGGSTCPPEPASVGGAINTMSCGRVKIALITNWGSTLDLQQNYPCSLLLIGKSPRKQQKDNQSNVRDYYHHYDHFRIAEGLFADE